MGTRALGQREIQGSTAHGREGFLEEVVWSRDGAGNKTQAHCLRRTPEWPSAPVCLGALGADGLATP